MKCCVSGNCTLLTCFPVHKLSHMYIIQIFVFLVLHFYSLFFEDEFTWKRVNLFLCVISPCPGGCVAVTAPPVPLGPGLLFNVFQQTDLRLVCFLSPFMLVQCPSRLFLGLEWKNGPEDSIPWQHHPVLQNTLCPSVLTTGILLVLYVPLEITVHIQRYKLLIFSSFFFFFKCIYFIPFCSILIVGTGSWQAAGTHYSFNL